MSKSKSPRRKIVLSPTMTVTLIVAALGCAGTVVTALITGYFAYLNTTTQIDRPITFTQTAESLPTVAPPPTQQIFTFDWKAILSIDPQGTLCPAFYVPEYLYAGTDKFAWVQDNLMDMYFNDQIMYATNDFMSGNLAGGIALVLVITSSPDNQDWITLSNRLTVTVHYIGDVPAISEIMQTTGCGAGGSIRHFSSVPLNIDYPEYNVISSNADADFFTLQPGEIEVFQFGFQCNSPGLYSVEVHIPITFQGRDEIVIYTDFPGFNCPNRLNYNYLDDRDQIYDVKPYEWIGNGYQEIPP